MTTEGALRHPLDRLEDQILGLIERRSGTADVPVLHEVLMLIEEERQTEKEIADEHVEGRTYDARQQ